MSDTYFHPLFGACIIERHLADERCIVEVVATGETAFVSVDELTPELGLEAAA